MKLNEQALNNARVSRTAIEKLHVEMRHLVNRVAYKPGGRTGQVIQDALLSLSPEIYGSMGDPEKVELNGLVYVIDRLPKGIEACRFVRMVSEEGYKEAGFEVIVPASRRRNCYRIDSDRMYIEVTRGRSEIYDILTHLSFLFVESQKIKRKILDTRGNKTEIWKKLEKIVEKGGEVKAKERNIAFAYLSSILGRTFKETKKAWKRLEKNKGKNSGLFEVVYWLGKLAFMEEKSRKAEKNDFYREISFTATLRQRVGHHLYGERWATDIKNHLIAHKNIARPLHIISANMHSVMNSIYAKAALKDHFEPDSSLEEMAAALALKENKHLRDRVKSFALEHGMSFLKDKSGTHIDIQIFDPLKFQDIDLSTEIIYDWKKIKKEKPIIVLMDYAFGEQAFETLDELLKPYTAAATGKTYRMHIDSISIMGKAGILSGGKGDIMIPTAHVFEGSTDNYPFHNDFSKADFEGQGPQVFEGTMITVLGTSLQNRDILNYFKESSWKAIGLEMEGAHYQKAIQSEVQIRKNIEGNPILRYAYYASDNPLVTGGTLASGSLGETGVKPAYLITKKILEKVLG